MASADLFGFQAQRDAATLTVSFFDGQGGNLSSFTLGPTTAPGSWPSTITAGASPNFVSQSGSLNAATQSVPFSLTATKTSGESNDGYADNIAFNATAVPLESDALPILGSVAFVVAGFCKRRRAHAKANLDFFLSPQGTEPVLEKSV